MVVWTSLYLLTEQNVTMEIVFIPKFTWNSAQVNNAGIFGTKEDADALLSAPNAGGEVRFLLQVFIFCNKL